MYQATFEAAQGEALFFSPSQTWDALRHPLVLSALWCFCHILSSVTDRLRDNDALTISVTRCAECVTCASNYWRVGQLNSVTGDQGETSEPGQSRDLSAHWPAHSAVRLRWPQNLNQSNPSKVLKNWCIIQIVTDLISQVHHDMIKVNERSICILHLVCLLFVMQLKTLPSKCYS